ncbi:hypothetical protein [Nocardia amamiensis]|uniref:hypothetical protein n=1 Tax=Nocardia amamiensis TaxID=404578 RepID=UPI0012F519AA|nr:hypothetical protein [Nocardia amamiensis]
MSTNKIPDEPIRTAPVDLYERLHGVDDRLTELRRELNAIRREYATLRRHPEALAVDTLGKPMDPVVATDAALHGLAQADRELDGAEQWIATVRGQYATRLKLTDAAADELARRRNRVERTR